MNWSRLWMPFWPRSKAWPHKQAGNPLSLSGAEVEALRALAARPEWPVFLDALERVAAQKMLAALSSPEQALALLAEVRGLHEAHSLLPHILDAKERKQQYDLARRTAAQPAAASVAAFWGNPLFFPERRS